MVEQAEVVGAADVQDVGVREQATAPAVPPVRRARAHEEVADQVADGWRRARVTVAQTRW